MESTFLPSLPSRLISRWPVLLVAALAGGLGGLAFSAANPPVYQAAAAVTVGIDYNRILPLELIVEDRLLDRVRQVAVSEEAVEATWNRLEGTVDDSDAYASPADLLGALRLDQRLSRWEFVAFDRDPERAARIANTWSEVAVELLVEARGHAERLRSLQGGAELVRCVALIPPGAAPDELWQCVSTGATLEDDSLALLQAEVQASRGLIGPLVFDLTESAAAAAEPVLWGRGLLVAAGAVLGALAAAAALSLRPFRDSPKKP